MRIEKANRAITYAIEAPRSIFSHFRLGTLSWESLSSASDLSFVLKALSRSRNAIRFRD
jgi:hypothetical protein